MKESKRVHEPRLSAYFLPRLQDRLRHHPYAFSYCNLLICAVLRFVELAVGAVGE